MTQKRVTPRALANKDIEELVVYHLSEVGEAAAMAFVDALESAYTHIGRHPSSGSMRYAHELNLVGLRSGQIKGFPHIVFYVEHAEHIDVWRVLHGKRDIPSWMNEPEPLGCP